MSRRLKNITPIDAHIDTDTRLAEEEEEVATRVDVMRRLLGDSFFFFCRVLLFMRTNHKQVTPQRWVPELAGWREGVWPSP